MKQILLNKNHIRRHPLKRTNLKKHRHVLLVQHNLHQPIVPLRLPTHQILPIRPDQQIDKVNLPLHHVLIENTPTHKQRMFRLDQLAPLLPLKQPVRHRNHPEGGRPQPDLVAQLAQRLQEGKHGKVKGRIAAKSQPTAVQQQTDQFVAIERHF
uniref:(northern house mosquito) hypothetical protein n=1 Tax=Culex pipiens TaxID=7175 RepID=A0A8D8NP59_CULPI